MIWGESETEREMRVNHKVKLALIPRWEFAWFPRKLKDGRTAWLQPVWRTGDCRGYRSRGYDMLGDPIMHYDYHAEVPNAAGT